MINDTTSWFELVVLAIVQGLTEFLPVSSSGHLVLTQALLGVDEPGVALEVILHLGTLLAVVLYYGSDWMQILGWSLRHLRGHRDRRARMGAAMVRYLILGTIPAAAAGVWVGDAIEAAFADPRFVCVALLFTGVLLLLTLLTSRRGGPVTPWRAITVGFFQVLALFPGVSRAGSTIAGGMFSGIRAEEAARFSFLLSAPIILGAAAFKAPELLETFRGEAAMRYIVGLLVAFVSGLISIGLLLKIVRTGRFGFFGIYCLVAGTFGLVWFTFFA